MKVFVPYTDLHPDVLAALDEKPVYVELDGSPTAYGDYFAERWAEGDTFINLEHDVLVHRGALRELWDCQRPWCSYHYADTAVIDRSVSRHEGRTTALLGCVKFSAEFISATRNVWADLRTDGATFGGAYRDEWQVLDTWLDQYTDINPHQHYPSVTNLGHAPKRAISQQGA